MLPLNPHKTSVSQSGRRDGALHAMRFGVQFINVLLKDLEAIKLNSNTTNPSAAVYTLYGQQVKDRLIEAGIALKSEPPAVNTVKWGQE